MQDPQPTSLAHRVAAPGYAALVNDVVARIAEAATQSDVLTILQEATQALGADRAMVISFVRNDATLSACRFLLACDPAWCRDYLALGSVAHDPWLAYAAHHAEPIVASTLKTAEPARQQVIDLAAKHGFASAVLAPAHSGAGHSRITLLCLGSDTPGYFEGAGFAPFKIGARILALELHDWWLARIRRELVVKAHLTPSDLALLRHQRLGHSSKRIAAELQVSKGSVDSRFQRLIVKLGVPNRRAAARLAEECGLLR